MRRLEFLLTSVRRSTDNVQTSAISDAEMIEWFNDGQKLIQNIVFKMNPKADIFKAVEVYDASSDGVYDLPSDIYSVNAISLVEASFGTGSGDNDGYVPISRVDESDRAYLAGYFTRDSQVIFTGYRNNQQFSNIRITYFKALPRFDKRWGTIQTVNSGVSLVLLAGYDDLAGTVDDYVTVVDSSGTVIRENIRITSFAGGATWTTTDALTGVIAGHFVCMGSYSGNLSGLPNECEPYLLDYVRKRLYGRNVYNDGDKQEGFTAEQKDELIRLFSNNTKEMLSPPITDLTFLDF